MPNIMETQWLRVDDVAKLFDVSPTTIRRLLRIGQLDGIRVGRSYRVDHEAIAKFVKEQRMRARRRSRLHRMLVG